MNAASSDSDLLGPLDYDALVADYRRGLIEHLRGFGAGVPELALWVPDEDLLVSLRNLLDAVATSGRRAVCLTLGHTAEIGVEELRRALEPYGQMTVESGNDTVQLTVRDLRVAEAHRGHAPPSPRPSFEPAGNAVLSIPGVEASVFPPTLHQGYAQRLVKLWSEPTHDRVPVANSDETGAIFSLGSVRMGWVADRKGIIARAGFEGAPHPVAAQLLERLSILCEGVPVEEARDHAVMRLEWELREANPVQTGIIIPEFADGAFAMLTALVRGLGNHWPEPLPPSSTFDPGTSHAWNLLQESEQCARIEAAIEGFCRSAGLAYGVVSLAELQFHTRVVVAFSGEVETAQSGALLLKLEGFLQRCVEGRLEVFLEEARDRNRKRRLSVLQPAKKESNDDQQHG